ncbi:hypothetical protein [Kribbella solani]|uniref:F5/8 type C domain-containing protein n=1 Tax=Kribbella solani TaxID=236067 RepID=A0A841DW63_9ACTN|nr:hypothetical protein [Kribbella solani]MBB5982862.1 hypothetical protein [Kribbella solani]
MKIFCTTVPSEDLGWDAAPWLQLTWAEPVTLSEIVVVLDADVQEDLINLHHHRSPFEALPTLLADYTLETRTAGTDWTPVAEVKDNHHRAQRHVLPTPIEATDLRLTAFRTHGNSRAHVVSIRAYRS